jgi:hypothetical protein
MLLMQPSPSFPRLILKPKVKEPPRHFNITFDFPHTNPTNLPLPHRSTKDCRPTIQFTALNSPVLHTVVAQFLW